MSKVSDADVEVAARVMAAAEVPDGHPPESAQRLVDICWRDFEETARAALEAVSSIHEAEPVAWPGRKFCEIAGRNIAELAKFLKGDDDKLAANDAALAITTLLAAHPAPISKGVTVKADRDALGRRVREAWVKWALNQPSPKPSWLVPYDDLSEPGKEADRQIGEALAGHVFIPEVLAAEPKWQAIQDSDDPAERLAYDLAVELEQADLDRNDFVTVNRAKLLAIAKRCLSHTAGEIESGGEVERLTFERDQLLAWFDGLTPAEMHDAIVRDKTRIAELEAALKPFVQAIEVNDHDTLSSLRRDNEPVWHATGSWETAEPVTLGDFRRARTALSTHSGDKL